MVCLRFKIIIPRAARVDDLPKMIKVLLVELFSNVLYWVECVQLGTNIRAIIRFLLFKSQLYEFLDRSGAQL